jgi:dTDP-4-dehydrorhamnose 3,5-epimerase
MNVNNPIIEKTKIDGCFIIHNPTYNDDRGRFGVTYNKKFYDQLLPNTIFIQDNISYSKYGVIRGIHFQKFPYEQSKLVSCVSGIVRDVIVDLRIESLTYGNCISIDLIAESGTSIYIPKGCGHGFSVLSNDAVFSYKVDAPYVPEMESGIVWNDTTLNIDWGIPNENVIISNKDLQLNTFI